MIPPLAKLGPAFLRPGLGHRYYGGNFIGDELAQRGYVVLATDVLGWGDRVGNGKDAQQALA